jgi:hypothetical protein
VKLIMTPQLWPEKSRAIISALDAHLASERAKLQQNQDALCRSLPGPKASWWSRFRAGGKVIQIQRLNEQIIELRKHEFRIRKLRTFNDLAIESRDRDVHRSLVKEIQQERLALNAEIEKLSLAVQGRGRRLYRPRIEYLLESYVQLGNALEYLDCPVTKS